MSLIDQFNELEPKQKVTAAVTIVLFLVFVYLAYDTFFGGDDFTPTTAETPPPTAEVPKQQTQTVATPAPVSAQPTQSAPVATVKHTSDVEEVAAHPPTPEQLALIKESESLQREYLRILNEYQIAELQSKLETANSKIAAAKLKTTKTQSQTKKLENEMNESQASLIKGVEQKDYNIQVSYVGERRGQWIAMLKINNNYFEVKVGTELPDGSVVDVINQNGVVLEKNGKKQYYRVPKSLD